MLPPSMHCRWSSLLLLCVLFAPSHAQTAPQSPHATAQGLQPSSLLKNGSFENWTDAVPDDWTVSIPITNGANQPTSTLQKGDRSSIRLSGSAETMAWKSVSQSITVKSGESYKLTFKAKSEYLKREGNQFDNCHVGFWFKNATGKTIGNQGRAR